MALGIIKYIYPLCWVRHWSWQSLKVFLVLRAVSEPNSMCGSMYLNPSVPFSIGRWSFTLWVTIQLSKRCYLSALPYLWLQYNNLWAQGVSLFLLCTILQGLVLPVTLYPYLGCMCKRITLQIWKLRKILLSSPRSNISSLRKSSKKVDIVHISNPFQVMVQPHNRHSSMSLYLATIAVIDTIVLSIGEQENYCKFWNCINLNIAKHVGI